MYKEILDEITRHRMIAIVRDISSQALPEVAEALYRGGVRCIEITYDQRSADCLAETPRQIATLCERFAGRMCVGAGTVLTAQQADAAIDAGARFLISPHTDRAVICRTRERDAVSIPGALTATEVVQAWDWGASVVKLFPAGELGTAYCKALIGPLGHIPFCAVGGVHADNVRNFLDLGMHAVGVGGSLVRADLAAVHDWDGITRVAQRFTDALKQEGEAP